MTARAPALQHRHELVQRPLEVRDVLALRRHLLVPHVILAATRSVG